MMKKTIILCALMAASVVINAQDLEKSIFVYDKYGNVQSVEFSKTDKEYDYIRSADVYFRDVLKAKDGNQFVRNESIRIDKKNETFEQYYKGIKVENAGYTFHYDENGSMRYAHGRYVDISNLDTKPIISKEEAAKAFAVYEGLTPDSITHSSVELIIKNIKETGSIEIPTLVYKVSIEVNNYSVTEYGYVDAKTGKVAKVESYLNHISASGVFYTKYFGTKYAMTDWSNNMYYLYDSTRDNGVMVKDLQNNSMNAFLSLNSRFITDTDNYWYHSDYNDSTFMAFDVFWSFQQIFDRLHNVYGIHSIDNNGKTIYAYVRALVKLDDNTYTTNSASWDNNKEAFFFGEGRDFKRPFSSIDIVAHEYGHAITHYLIDWSQDRAFLNEGLSDIWGAIMKYRYGEVNSDPWKIGEGMPNEVFYNCIRNLRNPADSSSCWSTDTYNSFLYKHFEEDNDHVGMSGPFSHWFYLLVNGGLDYSSSNPKHILVPVGMDVAESLIVKAVFENYLRYTTTYEGVRLAFIAAARAMNVNGLVSAVCNAWHAVGVGNMDVSLSGPHLTASQSFYTVNGLPNGTHVVWSLSNSFYNQNCVQEDYPLMNQCTITRSSSQDMMDATLTAYITYNGDTLQTLTKNELYAYTDFKGTYSSGNLSGTINYTHLLYATANTTTNIYSPNFIGGSASYNSTGTTPLYWQFYPELGRLYFTMPPTNNNAPVVIDVDDVCGNHYQLYALPNNSPYYLNISNNEGCITIMLNENSDTSERTGIVDYPWTLEVRSALTGNLKATKLETSRSASVSTIGWPKGVYIIKATVGDEVITEKITVK
jgi:Zn-dependent metalloprotease